MNPDEVIRDEIRALAAYHVPDPEGMVKLDAMENPYRLPQEIRAEIASVVESAQINRYPDAGAARLKARLRTHLRIPADQALILGNGSDEIIQMLMLATARPGACVLSVDPTFVMFRLIAAYCGMKYESVALQADFSLDTERMLAAIDAHRPALCFLAYPNNPTGNLFDDAAIERILQIAPGVVVIDEAYHAFAQRTYMDKLDRYPNLLVMRTLSKSGLAGLRLGLIAGSALWLDHVEKVRLPYNVGVLTQLVTEQVLQHQALLEAQAAAIRSERARVFDALQCMTETTAFASVANFILFRIADAQRVFDGLKARRVLVKNLHGSHPALENCLRVTIGTPEENEQFISALRACVT
jgi:histidinol-phosphate aminotransferase